MQKIKEVGIVSLAKIMAIIYAFFGLIVGIFISLSSVFGVEASPEISQLQGVGFFAIIIFPIIYGLIGGFSGIASGFFFNMAVNWVGPLQVKIVQSQE